MRYKKIFAVLFFISCNYSFAQVKTLKTGDNAPPIALLNANARLVSFEDYPTAKGFVVVFIANTCPYSRAYEQRISQLDKKYSPLGFQVIAINPNDSICSPAD